ncbi:hypothetical protein RND71_005659 [Anisodus tanguticus]|uniref:Uncharacterized protein n=1 Tax=Anisodus tanguticus TaxID=243964 RepID=A0AAE1SRZ0_9SOLA|nr:hypothetical protein RND71_005659 [Anisodus tanguticus]
MSSAAFPRPRISICSKWARARILMSAWLFKRLSLYPLHLHLFESPDHSSGKTPHDTRDDEMKFKWCFLLIWATGEAANIATNGFCSDCSFRSVMVRLKLVDTIQSNKVILKSKSLSENPLPNSSQVSKSPYYKHTYRLPYRAKSIVNQLVTLKTPHNYLYLLNTLPILHRIVSLTNLSITGRDPCSNMSPIGPRNHMPNDCDLHPSISHHKHPRLVVLGLGQHKFLFPLKTFSHGCDRSINMSVDSKYPRV